MRLFLAFARRDLLVEASYRVSLLFGVVSAGVGLVATWFLGVAVGPASPALAAWGGSYFAFAVLGLALAGPLQAAQYGFASRVREAQVEGTLEPVLVAPVPLARVLLYQSAYGIVSAVVRAAVFLLAAVLLFDVSIHLRGVPVALLAAALALVAYVAIGLMSAAFTLVLKRGDPVGWALDTVTLLLGGVMFPVEVMPAPLRTLSTLLPITHALGITRRALLLGEAASPAALAILGAFAAVLVVCAAFVFSWALGRAREDGSLTHY